MAVRRFNLAVIGFGNVGQSLVKLLLAKRAALRDDYGIDWRLVGVASRRLGWRVAPGGFEPTEVLAGDWPPIEAPAPTDVGTWLEAGQADALFEVSSLEPLTGQPAIDHVRAGLNYGAHVITANKGPGVHAHAELAALARRVGRQFRFEASVMGGAPIFSLFRECLPALELRRFRGLLNATTSVILQAIEQGGDFDTAIRHAQALGVAETDPSHDIDGWDSAVKLVALANVLFGQPIRLDQIERVSLRRLDPGDA